MSFLFYFWVVFASCLLIFCGGFYIEGGRMPRADRRHVWREVVNGFSFDFGPGSGKSHVSGGEWRFEVVM